jgi:hypothetical protein
MPLILVGDLDLDGFGWIYKEILKVHVITWRTKPQFETLIWLWLWNPHIPWHWLVFSFTQKV